MSRKLIAALILIGLSVLVLILNHGGPLSGKVTIELGFTEVSAIRSIVYFGFIAVGVAIGVLLK